METYEKKVFEEIWSGQTAFENFGAFSKIIEKRYDGEALLMNYISQGNLQACIELQRSGNIDYQQGDLDDIYKRYSGDALRSHKNAMIVLNTLCRVSARKGGVTSFMVNCISHKYALTIEQAPTAEFLHTKLQPMMISDYCMLVQAYSVNQYSSITRKIAVYIIDNLPSQITVNLLAEKFFLDPSALSRKFKHETGVSITEYINRHRITLAQYYLEEGYRNITEVSFLSGYRDSSYFCRVFKKITQITPTQYIKHTRSKGIFI